MEDEIVEAVRVISDQITSVSVVLVLMSSAGGLLQGHGISCCVILLITNGCSEPGAFVCRGKLCQISRYRDKSKT